MDLIRRGASRAIRTGRDVIDRELLDDIRIDEGAETERRELEAKLEQQLRNQKARLRRKNHDSEAEAA